MTKVTIISGFLGAGKTTLIKKLLKEAFKGEKVVLLENEYGEVGIDGGFMKDSGIEVTELNSGCICCTLAGDFTKAIGEIVERFNPDRLIIEPSGVGKLSDIRRVVEKEAEKGQITLTGSVTVVDAAKCKMYLKNFGEFFIDQVKCAETVILSRTQMVSEEKLTAAFELVREQNATCAIVSTPWDEIDGQVIVDTYEHPASLIDVDEVCPESEHHHHHHHHHHDGGEVEEYGIGTYVYYRRKPFSLEKFDRYVATKWPRNVIRAKGICYFSVTPDMSYLFEQAGVQKTMRESGLWFATMPPEELYQLMQREPGVVRDWDEEVGDRMIKIVFIGQKLDKKQIAADLDACLE